MGRGGARGRRRRFGCVAAAMVYGNGLRRRRRQRW